MFMGDPDGCTWVDQFSDPVSDFFRFAVRSVLEQKADQINYGLHVNQMLKVCTL